MRTSALPSLFLELSLISSKSLRDLCHPELSLRETDEVSSTGFRETVLPDLVTGTMRSRSNVFFVVA